MVQVPTRFGRGHETPGWPDTYQDTGRRPGFSRLPAGRTGWCGRMASKTAVAGADDPGDRRTGCPDRRRLLGLMGSGSRADDGRVSGAPLVSQTFAHWPAPIGKIETRHGLTYVHSLEPGGFSAEEFSRLPVGDRVELRDGVVVVKPELIPAHRRVMDDLYEELCDKCPKDLIPFDGRLDVRIGPNTVFRPDIQVLSREGNDPPRVLVVDALPARDMWYRALERNTKRHGYLDAGVASYWIVDPEALSVAVYEMNYLERGDFGCGEVCVKGRRNRWGLWAEVG